MIAIDTVEKQEENNMSHFGAGRDAHFVYAQLHGNYMQDTCPVEDMFLPLRVNGESASASADPLGTSMLFLEELRADLPEASSELLSAMVECIGIFKDWDVYKNDERFVKLCLEYSAGLNHPARMYEFMRIHKIGAGSTSFYRHWANYFATTEEYPRVKETERGDSSVPSPTQRMPKFARERRFEPEQHARHPASVGPKRVVSYSSFEGKRRRLSTSAGSEESEKLYTSTDNEPPTTPLTTEKKEKPRIIDSLVASERFVLSSVPRRTRRIQVYHDSEPSESSATDYDSLSFNELMLRYSRFACPVRPFEPKVPHSMDYISPTPKASQPDSNLNDAMYAQHLGRTEVVCAPSFVQNADTEVL